MAGVNPLKSYVENLKKSVVFIGYQGINDEFQIQGTGFLVDVKGEPFLVTAKHVVYDAEEGFDEGLGCFFRIKSKSRTEEYRFMSFQFIKDSFETDWIFHPKNDDEDNNIDIAVIFFPQSFMFDEEVRKELGEPRKKYEIDSSIIDSEYLLNLESVLELAEVFYIANQPGVTSQEDITPIIRHGTVSKINEDDSTFLIDGFAYPGNSGSPVFQLPAPLKYVENEGNLAPKGLYEGLIGVMGAYVPYKDAAISQQTGETRAVFVENSGLSWVWSTNLLKEIFNSKNFKKTLSTIKKTEAV